MNINFTRNLLLSPIYTNTMSIIHNFTIDKLVFDFQEIISMYDTIQSQCTGLKQKLSDLKDVYSDLIKTNNKRIFLFCLDSFYFQYKVLNMEMENITKFISLINNRMYGDYYKLYNIIILQSDQFNINTKKLLDDMKKYEVYKDLEPFHEYKIDDTMNIHSDILNVLSQYFDFYSSKEMNINNYNEKVGKSIINFINTLEYENTLVREQLNLYTGYITFFHKSHRKYLNTLLTKIRLYHDEINANLEINESTAEKEKEREFKLSMESTSTSDILQALLQEPVVDVSDATATATAAASATSTAATAATSAVNTTTDPNITIVFDNIGNP